MSRLIYGLSASTVVVALAASMVVQPLPRLIWNASASVPIGLYQVSPERQYARGDLVAAMPPEPAATLLAERDYLPRGVPLLKHIAAVSGERVCRLGLRITIDGHSAGKARRRDGAGRILPHWQGCQKLKNGTLFLMNKSVPDSVDGRYFGLFATSTIIGRLTPIWTQGRAGQGFVWGIGAPVLIPAHHPISFPNHPHKDL